MRNDFVKMQIKIGRILRAEIGRIFKYILKSRRIRLGEGSWAGYPKPKSVLRKN